MFYDGQTTARLGNYYFPDVLLFALLPFKADFPGTETSSNLPGRRLGVLPCAGGLENGFGLGVLNFIEDSEVGLEPDAMGLENGFDLFFFGPIEAIDR